MWSRLVCVSVVVLCLLAVASADVKNQKKMCTGSEIGKLALKVYNLKVTNVVFARVQEDDDPNTKGKRACKLIVMVGVNNPKWTKDTSLKDQLADLQAVQKALGEKLSKEEMGDIEIIQTSPMKRETETATVLRDLMGNQAIRSQAKRLQRFSLSAQGRLSATTRADPPTTMEGGQRTGACAEYMADRRGTLGGILIGKGDKMLALSNEHVYGSAACNGKTKKGLVAKNTKAEAGGIAPEDSLDFGASPAVVTGYMSALNDQAWDFATVEVKSGTAVNCQIDGKDIAGVRADSAIDKFENDATTNKPTVWKVGAKSLKTTGEVYGVDPYAKDKEYWGYVIRGTGPDLPNRDSFKNPTEVECENCYAGVSGTGVASRAEALAGDTSKGGVGKWDTRMWALPGDSGSWVMDSSNNVICLHLGGWWETQNGIKVKAANCIPFKALLDELDKKVGGGFGARPCKTSDLNSGKAK